MGVPSVGCNAPPPRTNADAPSVVLATTSEMGNVLLVERRVLQYRLALTCERGLIEIDVSHLPTS